jgi:hypothetical protein
MKEINIKNIAVTFAIALIIWFIPVPDGVTPRHGICLPSLPRLF